MTQGTHTHTHKIGHTCSSTWVRRSGENFPCYAETPVKIRGRQHDCKSSKCRHFYNAKVRGQAGCAFPGLNAWLVVSQRQSQLSSLWERRLVHRIMPRQNYMRPCRHFGQQHSQTMSWSGFLAFKRESIPRAVWGLTALTVAIRVNPYWDPLLERHSQAGRWNHDFPTTYCLFPIPPSNIPHTNFCSRNLFAHPFLLTFL